MSFVQENKSPVGTPMGSIKDRIKSFEFMKESGSTSPQSPSPIPPLMNQESPRMARRNSSNDGSERRHDSSELRDGCSERRDVGSERRKGSVRRQMRRSERREAEMRRENQLFALNTLEESNYRATKVQNVEENVSQEIGRQVPIAPPRLTPRITPRAIPRATPNEKEIFNDLSIGRRRIENYATASELISDKKMLNPDPRIGLPLLQNHQIPVETENKHSTSDHFYNKLDVLINEKNPGRSLVDVIQKKELKKEVGLEVDEHILDDNDNLHCRNEHFIYSKKSDKEENIASENEDDKVFVEDAHENCMAETDFVGGKGRIFNEDSEAPIDNGISAGETELEEEQEVDSYGEDDQLIDISDEFSFYQNSKIHVSMMEIENESSEPKNESFNGRRDNLPTSNIPSDKGNSQLEKQGHRYMVDSRILLHGNDGLSAIPVTKVENRNSSDMKLHKKQTDVNENGDISERQLYMVQQSVISLDESKVEAKQCQMQRGVNESNNIRQLRQRKSDESIQMAQTQSTSNTKCGHRRHGSDNSKEFARLKRDGASEIENPDYAMQNMRKLSQQSRRERSKSLPRYPKRSGSRSSLKSITAENIQEILSSLADQQRKSEAEAIPNREDIKSNSLFGHGSHKRNCVRDMIAKTRNYNELNAATQRNFYARNVISPEIKNTPEEESDASSSLDFRDPYGRKAFVCAVHEEPCKYYCQECERLICSECAMRWGDCHEHYYLRVKDAWKKYREEMTKILKDARYSVSRIQDDILDNSRQRDNFKLKVQSTIKKIDSFFDEHVQALEKRRSSFLETVEEIMKFREIGINQGIESLQNNLFETKTTINVAGHVYESSTMMEFLQVCKQLTNRLVELGLRKMKVGITENVDIDFITFPSLLHDIEKVGQLKKHTNVASNVPSGEFGEKYSQENSDGMKSKNTVFEGSGAKEKVRLGYSERFPSENQTEIMPSKDTNYVSSGQSLKNINLSSVVLFGKSQNIVKQAINNKKELPLICDATEQIIIDSGLMSLDKQNVNGHGKKVSIIDNKNVMADQDGNNECPCDLIDNIEVLNTVSYDRARAAQIPMKQQPNKPQGRRHSMDDVLDIQRKKDEIQRRLGSFQRFSSSKSTSQHHEEGERYFSSGEAEKRRRKQEYHKVRFNDRAYYSNPSDSSELEELRGYNFDAPPTKQKVRRHRTLPLIRPITERRDAKSPWTLDVFRYHGKIHFSRNSLKATGKAFGWNAVIGSLGFSKGKHSWKVRVTKWTAVGVCYKDDHLENPSWGAGNKWTWDSADMCFSPRFGVYESPMGEWIDGDIIALDLDCDNSALVVHNLRTSQTDKLYGFEEPVYPYFYLSVFRSISIVEIDGIQVGS